MSRPARCRCDRRSAWPASARMAEGRRAGRAIGAARHSADPIEIEAYGPVARAVHWAVAALAVAVVTLGWAMTGASRGGDSRAVLLSLHRSVGVLILALMVFRVLWRLTHPPPPLRGCVVSGLVGFSRVGARPPPAAAAPRRVPEAGGGGGARRSRAALYRIPRHAADRPPERRRRRASGQRFRPVRDSAAA